MNRLLLGVAIWVVLLMTAAGDLAWHYPQLPARVATHFDAHGLADGWSSRSALLTTSIVTLVVMSLVAGGLQLLVRFLPASLINVPHREFWLAPARAEGTRRSVGQLMFAIGCLLFVMVAGLNHLTLRANLGPFPQMGFWMWFVVGSCVLSMQARILLTVLRFRRR